MVYGNFSLTVLPMAVSVFLFAKGLCVKRGLSERGGRMVRNLSGLTFGVYLIHPLVISALSTCGLTTLSFSPWLSVPAISALVVVLSLGATALLKRVPLLGDWVV